MEAICTIGQKHKSFRVMQKLIIYKIMHSFYSILNIQYNVYVTLAVLIVAFVQKMFAGLFHKN